MLNSPKPFFINANSLAPIIFFVSGVSGTWREMKSHFDSNASRVGRGVAEPRGINCNTS